MILIIRTYLRIFLDIFQFITYIYLKKEWYVERNSRKLIKLLKEAGWELVDVRGSHHQYKHPQIVGRVTVPHPKKDLPTGTVKAIYRQAGWLEQ